MPRGVPKSGTRMTQKRIEMMGNGLIDLKSSAAFIAPISNESDEEIDQRIRDRFEVMAELANDATTGDNRAMIISGPPGLGKSFTVEKMLKEYDPDETCTTIFKGFTRSTGLYKTLYERRNPGDVIVFDDCDSVFLDDVCLNLLKAACDTTEERILRWGAETAMVDENGEPIPTKFVFEGSIIFITNYDMDAAIASGHRLAPHFEALISRAYYVDLAMKTRRDYVIRIKQVMQDGLFIQLGLTEEQGQIAIAYIEKNRDVLREVSIRCANKLGQLIRTKKNWMKTAEIVLLDPKRK